MERIVKTNVDIQDMATELVSGNIEQIFDQNIIVGLLVQTNNAIPENTLMQVEKNVSLNCKSSDGIWKLGTPLPEENGLPGGMLSYQRGYTVIDQDVYSVEVDEDGNDSYLQQVDGDMTYGLLQIRVHNYVEVEQYENDQPPGDGVMLNSTKMFEDGKVVGQNGFTELDGTRKVFVAQGQS